MAVNEGLKPVSNDQVPVDPNVRIPDHVKAAGAAAEALHQQLYQAPEPTPAAPPAAAAPEPAPAAQPEPAPAAQPAGDDFTGAADPQSLSDSEWARRYNSMRGRLIQAQRTIGSMEQQMTELGQELVRTQQLVGQVQASAPQPAQVGQPHGNLITDQDRENYGDELIDLARRAARETVTPELEKLRADNAELTKRVKSTGKRELFATLDGAIPNWRAINTDTRFINWLRLPNIYTGQIRQNMLKAAVDGAEAPKVIALFRDFLTEAHATGQQAPAAQVEQPAPIPAPREPALALDALAAPGRARPASGDSQVPSEKPIYSRAQISKFYDDKRRGLYAGRDAEVNAFEADLTAAQREGRIRG